MPKVPKVDPNICIGCGTCVALCPRSYSMGDDGKSHVTDPSAHTEQELQGSIDACPVHAISWDESAPTA